MALSDDLRAGVGPVWERVVTHSFVTELGDDTLPRETFDRYFDQDYLFLRDWAIMLSLATAKAPDFDAARQLVGFLHLGLGGEEGLFQQAFRVTAERRRAVEIDVDVVFEVARHTLRDSRGIGKGKELFPRKAVPDGV